LVEPASGGHTRYCLGDVPEVSVAAGVVVLRQSLVWVVILKHLKVSVHSSQWGDTGTAGAEKHSLEERQRAERKVRRSRQQSAVCC